MKKIILNVPMKFPGKKGNLSRLEKGSVIEKPTQEQLAIAGKNKNCCVIIDPDAKKASGNNGKKE